MNKRKITLIMAVLCACLLAATALVGCLPNNLVDGVNVDNRKFSKFAEFKAFIYQKGDVKLPYRLYSPEVVADEVYPLVMFLHGRGETGIDNKRSLEKTLASEIIKYQATQKCYVLVPQIADGKSWDDYSASKDGDVLNACLESIITAGQVDRDRLYMTGLSLGAYGLMSNLALHEGKFAAATALCGGLGSDDYAEKVAKTPIWFFHGEDDTTVKIAESQNAYDKVKAAGGTAFFQRYPGKKHAIWTTVYQDLSVWDWMFSNTLKKA